MEMLRKYVMKCFGYHFTGDKVLFFFFGKKLN